jgi:hypothetical protein
MAYDCQRILPSRLSHCTYLHFSCCCRSKIFLGFSFLAATNHSLKKQYFACSGLEFHRPRRMVASHHGIQGAKFGCMCVFACLPACLPVSLSSHRLRTNSAAISTWSMNCCQPKRRQILRKWRTLLCALLPSTDTRMLLRCYWLRRYNFVQLYPCLL